MYERLARISHRFSTVAAELRAVVGSTRTTRRDVPPGVPASAGAPCGCSLRHFDTLATKTRDGSALALAGLLLLSSVAWADSHEPVRNLVALSTSAKEDVASDLLVIQLFVEHEAREQAAAANQVNADMSWALGTAKAINAVKAQTLDYRTHPVYDEQRVTGWRVHQALRLESAEHGALTNLLGTLQQKLAIESVAYQISDSVRSAITERLTAEAVKRFMARAQKIADAFGRSGYTVVSVNIDSHGYTPPPMPYDSRALAMQAEVASPAIAPGQQALEVGITGTIELAAP